VGSGFRTFTAGEVLTASNVQNYLMDQSVMVFGGSAARSSAIGTANFEEGMVSYLTDTDKVEAYNGTNWVSVAPTTSQGLTLINTTSFSAVNSVSLPTGTFSSTYQNYKTILNITTASTNDYFGARYRASGSDISTGAYQSSYLNVNIAAATSGLGSSGSNQTTFTRMGYHLAFQPFYFEATWWSPNLAVSKGYTATALQIGTDGGEHFYTGGSFDDNTIADSVSFFPISGTFTGTLYCYGINK
jgi:protein involved in ribonucleotide reduction